MRLRSVFALAVCSAGISLATPTPCSGSVGLTIPTGLTTSTLLSCGGYSLRDFYLQGGGGPLTLNSAVVNVAGNIEDLDLDWNTSGLKSQAFLQFTAFGLGTRAAPLGFNLGASDRNQVLSELFYVIDSNTGAVVPAPAENLNGNGSVTEEACFKYDPMTPAGTINLCTAQTLTTTNPPVAGTEIPNATFPVSGTNGFSPASFGSQQEPTTLFFTINPNGKLDSFQVALQTPEPRTLFLMFTALAGIGLRRARRHG